MDIWDDDQGAKAQVKAICLKIKIQNQFRQGSNGQCLQMLETVSTPLFDNISAPFDDKFRTITHKKDFNYRKKF